MSQEYTESRPPRLWDKNPSFDSSVSERDTKLLTSVAEAMLWELYPASSMWKVKYLPASYIVGVQVPRDAHIEPRHFAACAKVAARRIIKVWCEWDPSKDCFQLCCKLRKGAEGADAGYSRKRLREGDD